MGIRWQATKEFLQRYTTVWRNVWAVRAQLDPPKRDEDERAFTCSFGINRNTFISCT